jgi:DNA repair protein RecO (recombination protein O)
MRVQEEVIILGQKDHGEDDVLVTMLSVSMGKLKGIAKHAKKSKRRFPNCLFEGNLLSMEFELRPQRDIHFLYQARLLESPFSGLSNQGAIVVGSYLLRLTEASLAPQQGEKGLFFLLKGVLASLKEEKDFETLTLWFETRLSHILGYAVNVNECMVCKRPYTFRGKAWFSAQKGGILCFKCKGKTGAIEMEPEEINLLKLMDQGSETVNIPTVTNEIYKKKLSTLLLAHIKEHISPISRSVFELRNNIFKWS